MDRQSVFLPLLSLQEMAMRKTVGILWSQADVLALIERFPFEKKKVNKSRLWEETVEVKVKDSISKLGLPESIENRMKLLVAPIGLQVPEWLQNMKQHLCGSQKDVNVNILKHLCWTSAGTVDSAKTAEKLVHLLTLDISRRFDIACGYCLVDSLPVLWQKLPERCKSFFNEMLLNIRLDQLKNPVQIYWVYVLKGEEYKLLERHGNFYSYAFASSVGRGNKEATEYFFQKMDNGERATFLYPNFHDELQRILVRVVDRFPLEKNPEMFCYLFSQIAPEVRVDVLRENPGCLFRVFQHWPWQDLFLEKTDLVWSFPPDESTYDDLLFYIKLKIEYSDYYFPELFREFFRLSPGSFRKRFVNHECQQLNRLFPGFIVEEDKETLKAVLRNIDAEDRFRLVSEPFNVFDELDYQLGRRVDLVEFCVREACPSREEREKLKEVYMKMLSQKKGQKLIKNKWQRFFEFLDEADGLFFWKMKQLGR